MVQKLNQIPQQAKRKPIAEIVRGRVFYRLGGASILFAKGVTELDVNNIEALINRYFKDKPGHIEGSFILIGGRHAKSRPPKTRNIHLGKQEASQSSKKNK